MKQGKLFEKILATRLSRNLEETRPGLSEAQYGFRSGRSTIDALNALKTLSSRGEVIMVVSVDIANNSIVFLFPLSKRLSVITMFRFISGDYWNLNGRE